jgi:sec-independent protein translocase protein TatA
MPMSLVSLLQLDAVPSTLAVFGLPGGWEWIIILALGLLLFGRRLPEVGRSLGQGIVEFKKGLKGVSEDVEQASNRPAASAERPSQQLPHGMHQGESRHQEAASSETRPVR